MSTRVEARDGLDPHWRFAEHAHDGTTDSAVRAMVEDLAIAPASARAMALRGHHAEDIAAVLGAPSLGTAWRAAGENRDIDSTAALLLTQATRGPVGICADYDVDGGASAAILADALRYVTPDAKIVVATPDRDREGFGPSARVLDDLQRAGARTIVTLDCGAGRDAILASVVRNATVPVLIDHHPGPHAATRTIHACNPWLRHQGPGRFGALCTAGLAWAVARSMARLARLGARHSERHRQRWTALAALGTACDVMPVATGPGGVLNRALLRTGIRYLDAGGPGLRALLRHARVHPRRANTQVLGWQIGPRINAGSRMGESALAASCLCATDEAESDALAQQLDALNTERKAGSRDVERALDETGLHEGFERGPINVVALASVRPGTAGLAAGWMVRRYGWPAVVLGTADPGSGHWTGSGRSALGLDLGALVRDASTSGRILHGGGHAQACGLSASDTQIDALRRELSAHAEHTLAGRRPEALADATLHAGDCAPERLAHILETHERLMPWGPDWATPTYGIKSGRIRAQTLRITRAAHVLGTVECEGTPVRFAWWRPPRDWPARLGLAPADGHALDTTAAARNALDGHGYCDLMTRVERDDRDGSGQLFIERARPSRH